MPAQVDVPAVNRVNITQPGHCHTFFPAVPASCRGCFSRCRSEILQRWLNNGRGDKIQPFLLSMILKIDKERRQLLLERKSEFLLNLQSLGFSEAFRKKNATTF